MRRLKNAGLFILSCVGTLYLGCGTCFADEYILDEGYIPAIEESVPSYSWDYIPEGMTFDEWQDWEPEEDVERVASASEATPSGPAYYPALRSTYPDVFDGSISTTQLSYFGGIVKRFSPATHYVLFRQSRYEYRLVYSAQMNYENNAFSSSASGADGGKTLYILYNTEYNTVSQGQEGNFRLTPLSYPVYTDLDSKYPVLEERRIYENQALLFVLVFGWLTNFIVGFFGSGKFCW